MPVKEQQVPERLSTFSRHSRVESYGAMAAHANSVNWTLFIFGGVRKADRG